MDEPPDDLPTLDDCTAGAVLVNGEWTPRSLWPGFNACGCGCGVFVVQCWLCQRSVLNVHAREHRLRWERGAVWKCEACHRADQWQFDPGTGV